MGPQATTTTTTTTQQPRELHISGPVLASLIHEMSSTRGDLAGVLLGSVFERETALAQDSSDEMLRSSTQVTAIHELRRLPPLASDPAALVSDALLESMADAVGSTGVLGYCAFRRDAPLHPSIRDKDMMNAIARRLYSSSIPLNQPMVFALFTSRYTSEELSTLEWSYAMWWCIYNSADGNIGQMEPAFIHIDTMTSSSNRVTEYATMTSTSPSIERIDLNASRDQVHGVDISSMMQQTARDTINNSDKLFDDIMGKIEDASKELARTEVDLQRLRAERDSLLAAYNSAYLS